MNITRHPEPSTQRIECSAKGSHQSGFTQSKRLLRYPTVVGLLAMTRLLFCFFLFKF